MAEIGLTLPRMEGLEAERPLVVDLDRTLLRCDLLHEDLTAYVLHRPFGAVRLWRRRSRGGRALRDAASAAPGFDPAILPYDEHVLTWLREQRLAGRTLVLSTDAARCRAEAIALHLGLFETVLWTGDGAGAGAGARRDRLVATYGTGGYDYVGNHPDDLAVWAQAGVAHVVGGSTSLIQRAGDVAQLGTVIPRARSLARGVLRLLRPHQWLKNLLVFVALFTAQDIDRVVYWEHSVVIFACFCLLASGVYVLNDMADLVADRHHPTKRRRPFAGGEVDIALGWLLFPVLMVAAIALSGALLPLKATLVLLAYLALTLAYTFGLKRQPLIDVITLAGLYTVRIVAGAEAISVTLTIWLLTFSIFIFTSLAIVKRVSELSRARHAGRTIHGRGYTTEDLELMTSLGVTSSFAATIVFALYVHDPATASLYRYPTLLWLAVPVLLYWSSRLWLLASRGEIDEDPLLFAARDRVSVIVLVLVAAVFAAAKFVS